MNQQMAEFAGWATLVAGAALLVAPRRTAGPSVPVGIVMPRSRDVAGDQLDLPAAPAAQAVAGDVERTGCSTEPHRIEQCDPGRERGRDRGTHWRRRASTTS